MISVLLAAALMTPTVQSGPYNYTGKLVDLMNEDVAWGMPTSGLPMQITISNGGSKAGPSTFSLKGPKWQNQADLSIESIRFADGALTGNVKFKNTSGWALDAVRFDIVSATEHYKGKDAEGKETTLSRALPLKQESPILFGDMPKDTEVGPFDVKALGLTWKPETIDIAVTAKLSGLTYQRTLFEGHAMSTLDVDSKGRLYVGSGQKQAIYRANLEAGTLDLLASTPEMGVALAVSPTDGTIAATWINGHVYNLYSPGGDEKATIEQKDDVPGMTGWPSMGHYDAKGNLYLGFGQSVAQIVGGKPSFVVRGSGQYEFSGYVQFDVAKDGTLFIGSEANVFRFAPGSKNGKKILQGPGTKLGRTHGVQSVRVDPNGNLWIADNYDGEFQPRICVYDQDGKFIWVFGRGGPTYMPDSYYDGQVVSVTKSMAIAPDGRVYISGGESFKSVMELVIF